MLHRGVCCCFSELSELCTRRARCCTGISALTDGAEHRAVAAAHAGLSTTRGCLSEIKADSRGNKLQLLLASATEITEQNKQAMRSPSCVFRIM